MLAKVRSRQGRQADAERLAEEAVRLAADTDNLELSAVALLDQAEVLDGARAAAAATEALRRCDRKGIVPLATRARRRLAELRTTAPQAE